MAKRTLDIIASSVGLLVLAPLLLAAACMVRLSSPGPVLYRAVRVGRGGRCFSMVKFRTMVVGADRQGPLVTAGGDKRVTPVGGLLRRTKLDELPALWNVLVGDMSLVGPRPENPEAVGLYTPEQRRVLDVRPGITSLASIKYRNEEALLADAQDLHARYFTIMQDKLHLEMEYLAAQSFWLDLKILAWTILAVFNGSVPHA